MSPALFTKTSPALHAQLSAIPIASGVSRGSYQVARVCGLSPQGLLKKALMSWTATFFALHT